LTAGKQGRAVEAVESLIDETRRLFHRMKLAAEQLHGAEEITAGMRGVLFGLDRSGPRTVPQMARARPVSRQHIQMLVNPLVDRRLVELVDNPAHKRSKLVRLTPKGRRLVDRMRKRESKVLGALGKGMSDRQLRSAAAVLRSLHETLAGDEWQRVVDRARSPGRSK
jgi:DNA-binding MarR family transcriptional regulator